MQKQQEHIWVQLLLTQLIFWPCLGFEVQTQTDHLQGDLGVLVLVVYLKPEAENTRNLTNKTT